MSPRADTWLTVKAASIYTVSQKVPTFKLSVTLSNLSRFSKIFHCWKALWNLAQNPYDITHLTLGMLLHYLGKLKIQISADIQQIWKKMQTHTQTPMNIRLRDIWRTVLCVCGLSSWRNSKSLGLLVSTFSSVRGLRALRGLPLPGRLSTVHVSRCPATFWTAY